MIMVYMFACKHISFYNEILKDKATCYGLAKFSNFVIYQL